MTVPLPGSSYIHKKTGDVYTVDCCFPIKLDGVWHENGVTLYYSEKTETTWARLTKDFLESFVWAGAEPEKINQGQSYWPDGFEEVG
jgi:hypothetical protein